MSIAAEGLTIDEFANGEDLSALGTRWRVVSDQVMGGISDGHMTYEDIGGRRAICLRGRVSLENSGGFLQLALDLSRYGPLDASPYKGVRLVVRGNAQVYNLHLKTEDTRLPWQSYRQSFETGSACEAPSIRAILAHIGEPTLPPVIAPAPTSPPEDAPVEPEPGC